MAHENMRGSCFTFSSEVDCCELLSKDHSDGNSGNDRDAMALMGRCDFAIILSALGSINLVISCLGRLGRLSSTH